MSNKKTVKERLDERRSLYRKAFGTDAGQRVLEDLKQGLKHGQTLYHSGQENRDLHYELGRQSVINDILFILNQEVK